MNKNCQNYCRSAKNLTLMFQTLFLDFSGSGMLVLAHPPYQGTVFVEKINYTEQSPPQKWIIFQRLICKSVRKQFDERQFDFMAYAINFPLLNITLFLILEHGSVLVIYCYIINHPQIQKLRRTIIFYVTVFLGQVSGCGLPGSAGSVSLGSLKSAIK